MTSGILDSDFAYYKLYGSLDDTSARALKRVLAGQLRRYMRAERVGKTELAELMHTNRHQVGRLLDRDDHRIELHMAVRAARVLGYKLHLQLLDRDEVG